MIAYIDGGARGNPGPAGFGVRVERPDGALVEEFSESIGTATNNVAEYRGLIAALEWARARGVRQLHIRSDSLLLVQQMLGRYKVRHPGLQSLHAAAQALVRGIGRVTFEHVPRARNAHADRLANVAMDRAEGSPPGSRQHPADRLRDPLSPLDRQVRLFIYEHFLETARAPDLHTIAARVGAADAQVIAALHALADAHALVLAPGTHTIWMAHPFSAVPTPYPVAAGGRTYFANCAWDAAGVLSLVGDGESHTHCDDCGLELAMAVRGGAFTGKGVVHYAVPPRCFWDNIAFT